MDPAPVSGPGSPAPFGRRAGAFAVDALGSALIGRLLDPVDTSGTVTIAQSLTPLVVLTVVYLVGLVLVGQTPGMRLLGLRVAHPEAPGRVPLVPAALRTALLLLLVPALISDRNGRGLHDRAAGTTVVRAQGR